jgi:hypothetical protein
MAVPKAVLSSADGLATISVTVPIGPADQIETLGRAAVSKRAASSFVTP